MRIVHFVVLGRSRYVRPPPPVESVPDSHRIRYFFYMLRIFTISLSSVEWGCYVVEKGCLFFVLPSFTFVSFTYLVKFNYAPDFTIFVVHLLMIWSFADFHSMLIYKYLLTHIRRLRYLWLFMMVIINVSASVRSSDFPFMFVTD